MTMFLDVVGQVVACRHEGSLLPSIKQVQSWDAVMMECPSVEKVNVS